MTTKARREFGPEFKQEAVALLEGSGRPLTQVATELGIQPSMLRNWREIARGGRGRSRTDPPASGATGPTPADLASQNAKLKRELDRTRMERDVLKKRMARPVCKWDFEVGF